MSETIGRGRPSAYTPELARAICDRLATGDETLRKICRDPDMPSESTVRAWAMDDREGFSAQYERARLIGYHSMADQVLDIADDGTSDFTANATGVAVVDHENIARSRLRVDTRKWLLAKALPKIYGDKLELGGSVGLRHEDALAALDRPGTGDQDGAAG